MNNLALKELLYKMAYDLLILGHRNSEWTGMGPLLEEDIAFSSMAQDKIGQSHALFQLLHNTLLLVAQTALSAVSQVANLRPLRSARPDQSSTHPFAPPAPLTIRWKKTSLSCAWIRTMFLTADMTRDSSQQAPAPSVPVPPPSEPGADGHLKLRVEGFQGTPEEIERQWYEQVYQGRGDTMKQLTVRAVVMGSLLGGVLSLTNLYIGLKSGWGFGVAITACILSYAIWTSLHKVGLGNQDAVRVPESSSPLPHP